MGKQAGTTRKIGSTGGTNTGVINQTNAPVGNNTQRSIEERYNVSFAEGTTDYQKKSWEEQEIGLKFLNQTIKPNTATVKDVEGTSDIYELKKNGIDILARRGYYSSGSRYEVNIYLSNGGNEKMWVKLPDTLAIKPAAMKRLMVDIVNGDHKLSNFMDRIIKTQRK